MNILEQKIKFTIIVAVIVFGIVFSVFVVQDQAELQKYDGPPKAVIVDQLYDEMPNKKFHLKATEFLEKAGYTVDIVTTKNVTVDFYKELPKMNYKYVIVRTHGAQNTNDVVLFTGEKYSEEDYIQEQLFGQVQKATPLREIAYKIDGKDSSEWVIVNETTRYLKTSTKPVDDTKDEYFAIGPNLVKHAMSGKFDDTVFLLGGCNTLSNPSLANSLIDRGASTIIGWDDTVGGADNDSAMLIFLRDTLLNEKDYDSAIEEISSRFNPETMAYPATLQLLT